MADLETTQSKLRTTPTAGVAGEHSAYYRRLLSAGYKGYIQGSIGGGTLYGALGLAIGGVTGIALAPFTAGQSLWLIPALGGGFGLYGAHAFADIGKTAAIIADSADTNEKRRYLLDRYYETPSEEEAKEIKRQLETENAPKTPEQMFHWRPALIGAAIGITLMVTALACAPVLGAHFMIFEALNFAGAGAPILANGLMLIGSAAIGALGGAVIGLDREHVRRWLDKAEFVVHEPSRAEHEIAAREQDIQRIAEASRRGETLGDKSTAKIEVNSAASGITAPQLEQGSRAEPISPQAIAGVQEHPDAKVSSAKYENKLGEGQILAHSL